MKTKKVALIIALVLVGTAGAGYFFLVRDAKPKDTGNSQLIEDMKENAPLANNDSDLPKNSSSQTSQEVTINPSLSLASPTFIQKDGSVSVSTSLSSDGTCVFQFTNPDDKPVVMEVSSSNKVCTASAPEIRFSKIGVWKLTAVLYSNGQKAEVSKDVSIK